VAILYTILTLTLTLTRGLILDNAILTVMVRVSVMVSVRDIVK